MSSGEHKKKAQRLLRCAVVTVSDTRTPETDTSGQILLRGLKDVGHTVVHYQIVPDEPEQIRAVMEYIGVMKECEAAIFNGGTGISKRDRTFDVIDSMLEKRLPGFGEIFRYLSYLDIGSAAIMSRATAGSYNGKIIVSIPGSPAAATLSLEKLILPELPHMCWELSR